MQPLYNGTMPADRVIFLNDVFFCANDALRLVGGKAGPRAGGAPRAPRPAAATGQGTTGWRLTCRVVLPTAFQLVTRADMACGLDYYYWEDQGPKLNVFDIWVLRDGGARRLPLCRAAACLSSSLHPRTAPTDRKPHGRQPLPTLSPPTLPPAPRSVWRALWLAQVPLPN